MNNRGSQLLEAHIRSLDLSEPTVRSFDRSELTARERLAVALGEPLARKLLFALRPDH